MISLCETFKWTRIGVIYVNDPYGSAYASAVIKEATDRGIAAVASAFEFRNPSSQQSAISHLRAQRVKIILCIIFEDDLLDVIGMGITAGLLGNPEHHWIFTDSVVASAFTTFKYSNVSAALAGSSRILARGTALDWPQWSSLRPCPEPPGAM